MPCYDHKVTVQLYPNPVPELSKYHEPYSLICKEGRQVVHRSSNVGKVQLGHFWPLWEQCDLECSYIFSPLSYSHSEGRGLCQCQRLQTSCYRSQSKAIWWRRDCSIPCLNSLRSLSFPNPLQPEPFFHLNHLADRFRVTVDVDGRKLTCGNVAMDD
jgi:hypothetical protein